MCAQAPVPSPAPSLAEFCGATLSMAPRMDLGPAVLLGPPHVAQGIVCALEGPISPGDLGCLLLAYSCGEMPLPLCSHTCGVRGCGLQAWVLLSPPWPGHSSGHALEPPPHSPGKASRARLQSVGSEGQMRGVEEPSPERPGQGPQRKWGGRCQGREAGGARKLRKDC